MSRWRRFITDSKVLLMIFAFAVLLFTAGALNLIRDRSAAPEQQAPLVPAAGSGEEGRRHLGPRDGDELPEYLTRKGKLLVDLARAHPGRRSVAVVSFDGYVAAVEAENHLKEHGLRGIALEVRVPLPEFRRGMLAIDGMGPRDAVDAWRETVLVEIEAEAASLEEIIPTVTDDEFRAVYQQDLEIHRGAAGLLRAEDPSLIFALVAEGSLSELLRLSRSSTVRLVDLPQEPGGEEKFVFRGILPEDTEVAGG